MHLWRGKGRLRGQAAISCPECSKYRSWKYRWFGGLVSKKSSMDNIAVAISWLLLFSIFLSRRIYDRDVVSVLVKRIRATGILLLSDNWRLSRGEKRWISRRRWDFLSLERGIIFYRIVSDRKSLDELSYTRVDLVGTFYLFLPMDRNF